MGQIKLDTDDRTVYSLSALFPPLFIERLVEPMFGDRARGEMAAAYLGAPLAYAFARMCRRPRVDFKSLHSRAAYEGIESRMVRSRAVELAVGLAAEGLDCVALKGLATALTVYPRPSYRRLPDVDFLFREADLPRLAECLSGRGFVTGDARGAIRAWGVLSETSYAPIFQADRTFTVDVHRIVDDPPVSLGLDTDLVFAKAHTVTTEWGECRVASREHSFAIAALNLYRDFYRPEALKGLFDCCLILNRFGDGLDWTHVEAAARRGRFVNRMIFFRDLLDALGAGRAPLFENRTLARWLRPSLAAVVENCRTFAWLVMSDRRKMLLEAGLLDSPLETVRLHWRRLRGLAAPPTHFLPGLRIVKAGDLPPVD